MWPGVTFSTPTSSQPAATPSSARLSNSHYIASLQLFVHNNVNRTLWGPCMSISPLIVSKFGGTSMADATAMMTSSQIVMRQKARLVVVSATSGTTNLLVSLGEKAQAGEWPTCEEILREIRAKHIAIADDLEVSNQTREAVEALLSEAETLARGMFLLRDCGKKARDSLLSLGERLSSVLVVKALELARDQAGLKTQIKLFDVRKVMRTDDRFGVATPLIEDIKKLCDHKLIDCKYNDVLFVTQGFIGATEEGLTTTLGRGGSDYSAALLAEALEASVLEIWTDVAGIATTDPRIVPQARPISEITFQEAAELAIFGAKILHPTTLAPAMRKSIPVFVGSTFDADAPGTWIRGKTKEAPLIRGMALKKDQGLLTLKTPKMLHAYGFLAEIFKVFNAHKVSVDLITTSEISVALTVDEETIKNRALLKDLESLGEVETEKGLTVVSLIGNNINHTSGLARDIFSAIDGINVRMICLGASKHNFAFLVAANEGPLAISRLHARFIEGQKS